MQIKCKYFIIFIIVLLIMINCKKHKNIKKNIKTVLKQEVVINIVKPEVKEHKIYGNMIGGNQYAGASYKKNEFYVIDHHSERKKRKILLNIFHIETGEIKSAKKLNLGNYQSPDAFTDRWADVVLPLYVDWFDDNYYLLNQNKITLLDKNLNIKGATFFNYEYCNGRLDFYLVFKQKDNTKLLLSHNKSVFKRKANIKTIGRIFKLEIS